MCIRDRYQRRVHGIMVAPIKLSKHMLDVEKEFTTEIQKINILNSAINSLTYSQKKTEQCISSLADIPDTTHIYKPVGRMFVLTKKEELKGELENLSLIHI
eukprot:TRINITY_DN4143_c0_g1_i3.p2 TRINITY_DN4143_c0_g1~~TRINITY_DN4143_c0_g1_i3.p2  ORF type:complete len:115 (+),score=27.36 TRINITY_DN4143_c0_g1_i3:44-346(+)